jgi:hypothetical protein
VRAARPDDDVGTARGDTQGREGPGPSDAEGGDPNLGRGRTTCCLAQHVDGMRFECACCASHAAWQACKMGNFGGRLAQRLSRAECEAEGVKARPVRTGVTT